MAQDEPLLPPPPRKGAKNNSAGDDGLLPPPPLKKYTHSIFTNIRGRWQHFTSWLTIYI